MIKFLVFGLLCSQAFAYDMTYIGPHFVQEKDCFKAYDSKKFGNFGTACCVLDPRFGVYRIDSSATGPCDPVRVPGLREHAHNLSKNAASCTYKQKPYAGLPPEISAISYLNPKCRKVFKKGGYNGEFSYSEKQDTLTEFYELNDNYSNCRWSCARETLDMLEENKCVYGNGVSIGIPQKYRTKDKNVDFQKDCEKGPSTQDERIKFPGAKCKWDCTDGDERLKNTCALKTKPKEKYHISKLAALGYDKEGDCTSTPSKDSCIWDCSAGDKRIADSCLDEKNVLSLMPTDRGDCVATPVKQGKQRPCKWVCTPKKEPALVSKPVNPNPTYKVDSDTTVAPQIQRPKSNSNATIPVPKNETSNETAPVPIKTQPVVIATPTVSDADKNKQTGQTVVGSSGGATVVGAGGGVVTENPMNGDLTGKGPVIPVVKDTPTSPGDCDEGSTAVDVITFKQSPCTDEDATKCFKELKFCKMTRACGLKYEANRPRTAEVQEKVTRFLIATCPARGNGECPDFKNCAEDPSTTLKYDCIGYAKGGSIDFGDAAAENCKYYNNSSNGTKSGTKYEVKGY